MALTQIPLSTLAGTSGTPVSETNKLIDDDDARMEKADTAVQPTGTPVANQLAYWTTAQTLAASTVTTTELESLTGIEGNVQDQLDAEASARSSGDALALKIASNLSDLDSAATARDNLGLGDSATKDVGTTAGSVAAGDDGRIVAGGTAVQPVGTPVANQLAYWTTAQTLAASTVTTTELESLTGIDGNVQDQLDAEASARQAADLGLQSAMPTLRGITYSGGYSSFAASSARAGWLDYGGADLGRIMLTGTGVGVVHDMSPLLVETLDPVDDYVRVKVSVELDTGTLVMQTTTRPMPLVAYRHFGVLVASGTVSSSSITVCVGSDVFTLANGGLEVVGTAYSGAPASGTGDWTLCAASDGSNALSARVAADGWHALNYALTADDYALWFATGALPYAGAGTMQALSNPSFESFTGTADDGVTDVFQSWGTQGVESSIVEAVSGGEDGNYAVKLTYVSKLPSIYYALYGIAGARLAVSFWAQGDGTTDGLSFLWANNMALPDTDGFGGKPTGVTATEWALVERTFDVPINVYSAQLYLQQKSGVGAYSLFDSVAVRVLGDLLAGLDLATQPVCSRTAGGEVLLHSASGVEVVDAPERITLATQTDMTASGYLLGDRLTHPAGYVVDKVLVTNTGDTSATVTLRAGSSGGTVMATGTVAATGLPVALPISNLSVLTATGGKIYVTGGATASPLAITVILVRA